MQIAKLAVVGFSSWEEYDASSDSTARLARMSARVSTTPTAKHGLLEECEFWSLPRSPLPSSPVNLLGTPLRLGAAAPVGWDGLPPASL